MKDELHVVCFMFSQLNREPYTCITINTLLVGSFSLTLLMMMMKRNYTLCPSQKGRKSDHETCSRKLTSILSSAAYLGELFKLLFA